MTALLGATELNALMGEFYRRHKGDLCRPR